MRIRNSGPRREDFITGAEIVQLRLDMSWTQKELAERIGAHALTISAWEVDRQHPRGLYEREVRRLMAERDARLASPSETPSATPE